MSEYFSETKSWGGEVKAELGLSNYATKADLKNQQIQKLTHQSLLYRLN